ncbi:virion structural protein and packaging [Cyanophage S-TIM5]|uniref:Virion structural protein and packaging n=1 Tax=Cyanophage S-TIM5 TaxID=1137745 RepID=H6WFX1_9CAUD|nr:virion structural protein and packaging [Cyanophage S-TIM5]AEZ65696.1 virion structural protein and packaging [Cyanophage S-TIM5]
MPGKLPGGKLRISRVVPPLSTVADPTDTEVKYFGLIRDDSLDDLESSTEALQEVLSDIQSVSERETEGVFNLKDVSILDGIEVFGVTREDLSPLRGAALSDGAGEAIVNPRQRLQDRITHFESFAGRGTPFFGSGPIKYVYYADPLGTNLPGTVSVASNGTVTGTGTNFNGSTGTNDPFTPHVLTDGNYVDAYNSNNERVGRYIVDGNPSSKTAMTVTNAATGAITAVSNVTLKVIYSHTSPPPFFTESITSTAFNAPDHIPSISQLEYTHRIGSSSTGSFVPKKYKEDWWEGDYERDFKAPTSNPYQAAGENADNDPTFNIIKDGNKNYGLMLNDFPIDKNLGIRYDFYLKKDFAGEYFKWAVQKYGEVKIDIYKQTGVASNGNPQGSWITVLDTTDESTYHVFNDKEENTQNFTEFREVYVNGGTNFGATASTSEGGFLDLRDTYTDLEDIEVSNFDNEFVPVIIRYWYGQNTFDKNVTGTAEQSRLTPGGTTPSVNFDLRQFNLSEVQLSGTISALSTAGVVSGSGTAFNTELTVGSRITINSVSYKVTAITNNTSLTVRNPAEDTFSGQSYAVTSDRTHKQAWNNYYTHVKGTFASGVVTLDSAYTGVGKQNTLANMNRRFDIVAYTIAGNAPTGLSATKNILNYKSESQTKYDFGPSKNNFYEGIRVDDQAGNWTTNTFTVSGIDIAENAVVHMMIQNNPYKTEPPRILPASTSNYIGTVGSDRALWVEFVYYPDEKSTYEDAGDLLSNGAGYSEIDPEKQALEERSIYFGYKYGVLPETNQYTSARYDGFLENKITTSNTEKDYDYNHDKLLAIGRQKKDTAIKPLQSGETRPDGANYTFFMYEADAYNNGGRVQIFAGPTNSLAAIFAPTAAGVDASSNPGKILHSTDNVSTFSNANKQNLTAAVAVVTQGNASSFNIYQEEFLGGPILVARKSTTAGDYKTVWSTSDMGDPDGRNTNNKTFFLAYVSQSGGANAYFRELINAERPSVKASSITLTGGGSTPSIQDASLFPADSSNTDRGSTPTDQNNVPYKKARVVLYNSNDSTYTNALAEYTVTDYTASSTTINLSFAAGTGTAQPAGTYRAIVYHNYLKLSQALHSLDWTDENGIAKTTSSIGDNPTYSGTNHNMVINGVYSTSATYSRVDNGSTLSFGDALLVEPGSNTSSALNPYSSQTELPFPPSGAVTPFGFDKSSSDINNPGLGGICYPPIDAPADPALSTLAIEDAGLYGRSGGTLRKAEGHYDTYFGGKSLTNIGLASMTVTRGFVFDFPSESYNDIITTPTSAQLPTFSSDSYTHKLRVELSPYIGEPNSTFANATGLFSRSALYNDPNGDNTPNPHIYNDATTYYSTQEPVKEAVYLFTKSSSINPTSETDVSLISTSSVSFI